MNLVKLSSSVPQNKVRLETTINKKTLAVSRKLVWPDGKTCPLTAEQFEKMMSDVFSAKNQPEGCNVDFNVTGIKATQQSESVQAVPEAQATVTEKEKVKEDDFDVIHEPEQQKKQYAGLR